MDDSGTAVPGIGNDRRNIADSSDGAFLYGDRILLREELQTSSRLVLRDEPVQEASGEFREAKSNDPSDEIFYRGHSYGYYGDWLCSHEQGACGKRVPGHSLGVPCPVVLPEGEDR